MYLFTDFIRQNYRYFHCVSHQLRDIIGKMTKKPPNKNNNKKTNDKPGTKSSFGLFNTLLMLTAVLGALSSFYVFKLLTTPPPLPHLDPEQWWGEYPIDPKQDVSVRPYRIEFSDVMINDLRERLLHRRPFQPPLEDTGFTYGFNTHFLTQVLDYWQNKYDFKEREHFLNKYDHFVTNIQGLDVHFMRVTPKVDGDYAVIPLLMLHGWPGSIREFYEVIPKLTAPRPGYKFVFEVIAPSLPGYGFSQAAVRPGLGSAQVAVMMHNLMKRLDINHYYVQGGDWGHSIGSNLATLYPTHVLGFHTNSPIVLHPLGSVYHTLSALWPSAIIEPELQNRMFPLSEHIAFLAEETGYLHLQATKPDTVGIALTDSPAGLASYILEKFSTWTNKDYRRANDGNLLNKFSLTHLLDNIMIYWTTNSITTSMRLYAETFSKKQIALKLDEIPTEVPTWGLKFKHELMFQPDLILKLKYKNYLHSTVVEDGGHFAAFERPETVADDLFEAVDTFLHFHAGSDKSPNAVAPNHETAKTIYDFTVKDIKGRDVKLDKYKGHVTLIVNVASQCGLTDSNYKQLNELYEKYSTTKGLRILAFPCNQFGGQEPGSSQDIQNFAKDRGVKFDLFDKIEVNGENAHPLWKFLKRVQGGSLGDFIKWNFSKFIVDKNGVPVERLAPTVTPLELEPLLAKYW